MLLQALEDLPNIVYVLFPTLIEDQDIVQVHYHERVGKGTKYVIHQPHEGCGGIPQPERHDQPFEKALIGLEGHLPHIRGFNWYLVITRLQVNLAEIFMPLELAQKVINLWDCIHIPNSDLIQFSIVNTKSPSVIFLLYQHDHTPTG